jgi:excisionase family DNA binding protein
MTSATQEVTRFLSIDAAARYASLSAQSIRRWISAGRLKAHRPGGKILIDRQELEDLILHSGDDR